MFIYEMLSFFPEDIFLLSFFMISIPRLINLPSKKSNVLASVR